MAGGCTFSVDPQEGTGLFPILEDVALSEPHGGAFVAGVICGIEVYEWIRRRKPICKVLAQLVPYKHLSPHGQQQSCYGDYERLSSLTSFTRSHTSFATFCNSSLIFSPPSHE